MAPIGVPTWRRHRHKVDPGASSKTESFPATMDRIVFRRPRDLERHVICTRRQEAPTWRAVKDFPTMGYMGWPSHGAACITSCIGLVTFWPATPGPLSAVNSAIGVAIGGGEVSRNCCRQGSARRGDR